jgi:hypothetical protein
MISVTNLHFSGIEGSGPNLERKTELKGKGKTLYIVV